MNKIKKLLFYGILLALVPITVQAVDVPVWKIYDLLGGSDDYLGATYLFPSGGGTGTSSNPSYGNMLVGNAGGTYTLTATSSLGISGTADGYSAFAWTPDTTYGENANATSTPIWLKDTLYASSTAYFTDATTTSFAITNMISCNLDTDASGNLVCGSDAAGSGSGLATSTVIADTYMIYGTAWNTVGAEAAFVYDDATDRLTVVYASTTGITATNLWTTNLVATGNVEGATYGSDGTVSDAELLYINSLSGNAQTQFAEILDGTTAFTGINLGNDLITDAYLDWGNFTDLSAGGAVDWGNMSWTEINDYPLDCTAGQVVSGLADALTCVATSTWANTALALDADPADCSAGQVAIAIDDVGDLTCAATSTWANTLALDPTDCAANTFADAIDASGNLTCNGVVDADVSDTLTCSIIDLEAGTITNIATTEFMIGVGAGDASYVAMSSDCTMDNTGAITCDHDALDNFAATEHVDWAGASAGTIHTDNYVENPFGASIEESEMDITSAPTLNYAMIWNGSKLDWIATSTWDTTIDGCTDCLNDGEIEDIYLHDGANDTMTGTLTCDGVTMGANENLTLGGQTLDHDGTDFVFNDTIEVGANDVKMTNADITGNITNYFGGTCGSGAYVYDISDAGTFACTDATTEINSVVNGLGGTNLTCAAQTCNVDDAFLKLGGDVASAGTYNFGSASVILEIPNAAAPVADAAGEMHLDTTDNQLQIADSGNTERVFAVPEFRLFSFVMASTSPDFVSGGILDIPKNTKDGRDITQYRCHVDSGTSVVVNISDGTNDTETITCATTQTSDTNVSSNSTFTADELWEAQIGTITGTVDYLIFEAYGYITVE